MRLTSDVARLAERSSSVQETTERVWSGRSRWVKEGDRDFNDTWLMPVHDLPCSLELGRMKSSRGKDVRSQGPPWAEGEAQTRETAGLILLGSHRRPPSPPSSPHDSALGPPAALPRMARRIPPSLIFFIVLGLILSAAYRFTDVDPHAAGPRALRALFTGDFSPEVVDRPRIAGMAREHYLNASAPL